jgi:hypothetical protein
MGAISGMQPAAALNVMSYMTIKVGGVVGGWGVGVGGWGGAMAIDPQFVQYPKPALTRPAPDTRPMQTTPQDKAALLAAMDPQSVARLLSVMDPREAVLLLSALGDGGGRLVGEALPGEERRRLVQVRVRGRGRLPLAAGLWGPSEFTADWTRLQYTPSQMLQSTDEAEAASGKKKGLAVSAARQQQQLPGSFRDKKGSAETAGRIVSAYEVS